MFIDNLFVRRETGNILLGDPSYHKAPQTVTERLLARAAPERQDLLGIGLSLLELLFRNNSMKVLQSTVDNFRAPIEVGRIGHESLRNLLLLTFTTQQSFGEVLNEQVFKHDFLLEEEDTDRYCEISNLA